MKNLTLCFIVRDDEVLLGKKKRGFGVGRFNGFGGKLENDETIHQGAVREIREEVGIIVEEQHLVDSGYIIFHFDDAPDASFRANIFTIKHWTGEEQETEEMLPKWFSHGSLPFDEMWEDDPHWVPQVLSGKKVSGSCSFTSFSNNGGKLRRVDLSFL